MYLIVDENGKLLAHYAEEQDMDENTTNVQVKEEDVYEYRITDKYGCVRFASENFAEIKTTRQVSGGCIYVAFVY